MHQSHLCLLFHAGGDHLSWQHGGALSLKLKTRKAFLKIYFLPPGVPSRGQDGQLVLPPAASSLPPRGGGWRALQGSLERGGTLGKGRQIAAGKGALTKVGQRSLYLILSVTIS